MKSVVVVVVLAMVRGCALLRDPCSPAELSKIEARYLAEVTAACTGETFEECKARPEIEDRYARLREEWARCH